MEMLSLNGADTVKLTVSSAQKTVKEAPGETSLCGDGQVDPDFEDCDGDFTNAQDCPYGVRECQLCAFGCVHVDGFARFCGDENVDEDDGERCDDGNDDNADGCTNECRRARPKFCVDVCDRETTFSQTGLRHHRTLREERPASGDGYGLAVAISGDWAAIGTRQTEIEADPFIESGTVTLLQRDARDHWAPVQVLRYPPALAEEGFPSGFGEAIDMDGEVVVVGVRYGHFDTGDGRALVFEPNDQGVWVAQVLENPDRAFNAPVGLMTDFGVSVSISGDWLAIGATGTENNIINDRDGAGAVYLYQRQDDGWRYRQKVMAPDANVNDFFGAAIELDAGRLLVGAPGMIDADDELNSFAAGRAYLFALQEDGRWVFWQGFQETPMRSGAYFGSTVALDGRHAIMTAPGAFAVASELWTTHSDDDGRWTDVVRFEAPDDPFMNATFGYAITIEGDQAVIGSRALPWTSAQRITIAGWMEIGRTKDA